MELQKLHDLHDNSKSSNSTQLLNEWLIKFKNRRNEHINCATKYHRLYWIFSYINIILSAGGSIFSTISASDQKNLNSNFSFNFYLLNGFLHFTVLILTGIQHFSKFNIKEKNHLNTSNQFSELIRVIEYELILDENERNINSIIEKYDKIIDNEPLISKCF